MAKNRLRRNPNVAAVTASFALFALSLGLAYDGLGKMIDEQHEQAQAEKQVSHNPHASEKSDNQINGSDLEGIVGLCLAATSVVVVYLGLTEEVAGTEEKKQIRIASADGSMVYSIEDSSHHQVSA
jgi:hypothetical protein